MAENQIKDMKINLLELIGKKRLNQLQQRFFKATGFPNACLDQEGILLAHAGDTEPLCMNLIRQQPIGLQRCQELVKKSQQKVDGTNSRILRCHAGLLDARIPIQMDQEIIGYLVMGQVLDQPADREQAESYALQLGIDQGLYWEAMQRVKVVPREKIEAASQLLEFMGSEIATMASANIKLKEVIEDKTRAEDKLTLLNDELIATNKTLHQEQERFRLLVENTLDAIFVTDESGEFTIVNKQACRSTGYTEDELLKMHTGEIEVGHTEAEIAAIFEDLKQGKVHRRQGVHRKKDGSTFPVETMLCSYTFDGKMTLLAVARDVSQRKKVEMEREQLIGDLQAALAEIKQLSGMLPICSSCKKVRDDKGYWNKIESYLRVHSGAVVSHSICPECIDKLYGQEEWFQDTIKKDDNGNR